MSIQQSINNMLATTAVVGGIASHTAAQQIEASKELEVAETNFEYQTKEAANAIKAHAKDEGLTEEQIKSLDEKDINKLAENVQKLRETTLKTNREERLEKASAIGGRGRTTEVRNQQLQAAYNAGRELNDRITAMKELKFTMEAAQRKLSPLGIGGKK